jgi:hypothetical protein
LREYAKASSCEPLKVYKRKGFRMDGTQSLSHTVWECKYHVVWTVLTHE